MNALLVFMLSLFASVQLMAGEGWMTDIDEAVKKAKELDKAVMVEFTGSDWCPPCKMMEKEVFSKPEFVEQASKKYVLVKIDIPNSNPELKAQNSKVMKKYKVKGVPTVILFDQEGEEFNRFTASQFKTVETFLENLEHQLKRKDMF